MNKSSAVRHKEYQNGEGSWAKFARSENESGACPNTTCVAWCGNASMQSTIAIKSLESERHGNFEVCAEPFTFCYRAKLGTFLGFPTVQLEV